MSAIKALIIGVAPASLLLSACSAEVMTAFVDGMAGTSSSAGRTSTAEARRREAQTQQQMLDEIRRAEAQQRHQQTTGSSARPAPATPRPATTTTRPTASTTRPAASTTRPAAAGGAGSGARIPNDVPAQSGRVTFTGITPGRSSGFQNVAGVSNIQVRIVEARLPHADRPDLMGVRVEVCNRGSELANLSVNFSNLETPHGMDIQGLRLQPGQCDSSGRLNALHAGRTLRPGAPIYVHVNKAGRTFMRPPSR